VRRLGFFSSRRSAERTGKSPAVEAALREKRARDHLARKRRQDRGRGERPPTLYSQTDSRTPQIPNSRTASPRSTAPRTALPTRPLPRLVVPACSLLATLLGFAAARPLFEGLWLPRAPLERVAVLGTAVRKPESIARALLESAGAPLSRIQPDRVEALVTADPWFESTDSFRLPDGTLLIRVVERRAIARHQSAPENEIALVDPEGRRFMGAIAAAGPLPLVAGFMDGAGDSDAPLSPTALEILAELARHEGLARNLSALTLHLPVRSAGKRGADDDSDPLGGDVGFVLEIGREGPRVLLGQSFLKRRIARLASLLDQRDALLAGASVIDLRYADRAVLRTELLSEPTSG
jgi:POTRA domain, FtsQ-type